MLYRGGDQRVGADRSACNLAGGRQLQDGAENESACPIAAVFHSGLEEQDANRWIFDEAVGKRAACAAHARDDEVEVIIW